MMLLIYFLLVFHTVIAHDPHHHKDKVFYNLGDAQSHYELFLKTHNMTYNEVEKAARFEYFKHHLAQLNELNRKEPHCTFAINQFADLSPDEFLSKHTGLLKDMANAEPACRVLDDSVFSTGQAPSDFDWRNYITMEIKNQAACGSCWAFAATGNVEAQYYKKYKGSISLSEQQIIDCDKHDAGCCGGNVATALRYLIEVGGQIPENVYPYISKKGRCKFDPKETRVRVSDCIQFNLSNEDTLKEVLFKFGPVAAAIDSTAIISYAGGVITKCKLKELNHAVLIVGYGTDELTGVDYWVIKNSWGPAWGEAGYVRVLRGVNSCGLLNIQMTTAIIA